MRVLRLENRWEAARLAFGFFSLVLLALPASAQFDAIKERSESLKLYALHCSPCHGARGRGDGPGGRFLDPAPRNFQKGVFKMVSTTTGIPSDKDLYEVIAAGLPGTSMLPFAHLGPEKISTLVSVVRGFHAKGLESLLRQDATSQAELLQWVTAGVQPGEPIDVAPEPPNTVDSRFRGRLHYRRLCASCHAVDGRGALMEPTPEMKEAQLRSRDLTSGVMKGGTEARSLFARIRCGMPGTPMPQVSKQVLDDEGVWDIVHYLSALIPPGAQAMNTPQGWRIFVPRIQGKLALERDDPRWKKAPKTNIAMAPFRADEASVRGVTIQALHDGTHIVFKATYPDATRNIPSAKHAFPPDGFAARLTNFEYPPILPIPGLPLPLDRALWTAGDLPEGDDPIFDGVIPRFVNPDKVCIAPIGPELVGKGHWQDRMWTVILPTTPDRGGEVQSGKTLKASFAIFDGALKRGPLPVALTPWQTLVFE